MLSLHFQFCFKLGANFMFQLLLTSLFLLLFFFKVIYKLHVFCDYVYMKIIKTKAKNCSEKEGIFASGIL